MSVSIATRVFGSEPIAALIRYYAFNSSRTMNEAANSLEVPRQMVNRHTKLLLDAGVLVVDQEGSGPQPATYRVDPERVDMLLNELRTYLQRRDAASERDV